VLVDVQGLRLEVATWEGPAGRSPIVLLHEGLGSVSAWGDFPGALGSATGRSVIAYSRAGYGQSSLVSAPFETDYMHREAESLLPALLDRLEIPRAIFFGHSDGASIALIFAARFPQRTDASILEAPHVFVEPLTVESIAQIATRYPHDERLRRGLSRHHADSDLAFRRWSEIWLSAPFREWNITALLPEVHVPVLVLQGNDDEYGTRRQVQAIADAVPHAEIAMLDGCRHAPHRDARAEVLARTETFLARVAARTPAP